MGVAEGSIFRRVDQSGWLLLLVRIVLGGMFVWMGLNKVADPHAFLKGIHLYDMFPESPPIFLNVTAMVLPWLEIVAGVALIVGVYVRGAASMILVMLLVFTPAVFIRALAMQSETGQSFFEIAFDCGCGSGVEIIWEKLLKNTGYVVLALVAFASRSRRFCAALWFERRRPVAAFCHICGYAVRDSVAGLCRACSTPPILAAETSDSVA